MHFLYLFTSHTPFGCWPEKAPLSSLKSGTVFTVSSWARKRAQNTWKTTSYLSTWETIEKGIGPKKQTKNLKCLKTKTWWRHLHYCYAKSCILFGSCSTGAVKENTLGNTVRLINITINHTVMPSWGAFWRHIIQQGKISNGLADVCLQICSLLTSVGWRVRCNLTVPQTIMFLQLNSVILQEPIILLGPEMLSILLSKSPFHPELKKKVKLQKANTLFGSIVTQPM